MGMGEIVLIFVIYLLLFGAKGLPSLAQTMGKAVYQFRNAARDVQGEIMRNANDIKRDMGANASLQNQADSQQKSVSKPAEPEATPRADQQFNT